ncbi:arabinan endo-1,5-alpha-L-arabinosidase [Adhaeribacter pallidiroseus]|uniref:Arabinan endo-1,5-alpha-L-arabinosidase n=1 Tax=Adhaeribacter pallidiroseus TaxID=2072847 RepID=A0A369QHF3_9BACT|nr:arabinan endo-1,5-alpha-L-arabinosidase [Adhaeribacter pallidiroseus]RDC63720.1 Arabinan endo-1,5-alpha-L-arabinosidase [Adhaeribacter pallidiroseus]
MSLGFFLSLGLWFGDAPVVPSSTSVMQDQQLQRNISVHDPVMIKQGDTYYLFCTGRGIAMWSSKDMQQWQREKPVFENAPDWAIQAIPGFKNHIWAPDISFYQGVYYLYYSVSAFGKNTSAIGLVTNKTLNPSDKDYKWVDHGKVIQSIPGQTNWNAIDPNVITDSAGNPYLTFGSFWEGLKLIKLSADRKSPVQPTQNLPTIASRKSMATTGNMPAAANNPVNAGENAIEAPFIFKKNNYYYLFASFDYCCKGVNSTYKIMVGRAKDVQGPYMDKAGKPMTQGGGSLVLAGDSKWYGVGHSATYTFDNKDYLIFHAYDAADNGKSKLRIEPLTWDIQGWPVVLNKAGGK